MQLAGLQDKAGAYRTCCLEEGQCQKNVTDAEKRWNQARKKKEKEKQALDKAREAVAGLAEQAVAAEQAKARWQALNDRLQREGEAAELEAKAKEAQKQWQHSRTFLEKAAAKARDERIAYESVQALRDRVLAAGFESVKACRAMQAAVPQIPELEESVRHYDQQVQQVQGQLDQEEAAIGTQERPDVAAARAALDGAEKASQALVEAKGSLTARYQRWQQEKEALAALQQEGQDLTEAYKTVGAVYELIAGKQTGINFERYVLGALLDEVLAAANGRLQGMSRQRYSLQRSQSWDDKRVKQIGLDIEVYDNYTGYARPANTLSGGETFLASLSLALGLADVVQTYSGGIHLDTMFIDEGFGTLDGETLDYALKTLASLRSGGRLVGIISHVPELKERIDARLAVHKTDRGSTSSFEFA